MKNFGDKIHLLRDPLRRTKHKQTKFELKERTGKECGMSSWTQFSLSSLVCGTWRMQQIRNTSWRFFLFYDRTIPEAQRTYQALAILVNWIWLLRPLATIAFPVQRLCPQNLLYWAGLGVSCFVPVKLQWKGKQILFLCSFRDTCAHKLFLAYCLHWKVPLLKLQRRTV